MNLDDLDIAVIVPCHNEELTVATVVHDLAEALPHATIYVYDNNSTDQTSALAAEAGAVVRFESRKGKGNVVRRAFADIEADVYMIIDGDDTYDASAAPVLIETLLSGPYDHVVGCRVDTQHDESSYRPGHELGNKMFNTVTTLAFGEPVSDMLSGYRAFSRRYIKSFPANSEEFEIETELTIHAVNLRVPRPRCRSGSRTDRKVRSPSSTRSATASRSSACSATCCCTNARCWCATCSASSRNSSGSPWASRSSSTSCGPGWSNASPPRSSPPRWW